MAAVAKECFVFVVERASEDSETTAAAVVGVGGG